MPLQDAFERAQAAAAPQEVVAEDGTVAEAPAADTRASPPGHDNDADDDRTTVLISDDNADIRAYIRRHLEAALPFRRDQGLGGQPAEQLPQGADAGAIGFPHAVQAKLLPGRQPPEHDVGADAPVGQLRDRSFPGILHRILPRGSHGASPAGFHKRRPSAGI